jgi:hypothetical protein
MYFLEMKITLFNCNTAQNTIYQVKYYQVYPLCVMKTTVDACAALRDIVLDQTK